MASLSSRPGTTTTLVVSAAAGAVAAIAYYLKRTKKPSYPEPEASLREELTDAHVLSHHYGFDELVWNHISARVEGNNFLVTSGEEHFEEVRPETLVLSSSENANITADVIHSAIYKARPDVGAIVHHHTTAVAAVGVMKCGLRYLIQDAGAFYGKVSYHAWEGISDDYDECERLAKSLGPTNHTLIMRNHGALTVGRTVAEAWTRYFFLERCCKVQVACGLGTNEKDLVEPDQSVLEHAAAQYVVPPSVTTNGHATNGHKGTPLNGARTAETTEPEPNGAKIVEFTHGKAEWPALKRLAKRLRRGDYVVPVRT